MDTFLQIWGGVYFLLNKIFFSRAERTEGETAQKWEIWSWIVYLTGLPAVVALLVLRHDWIFAALEAGGAPLLVLGFVNAIRGKKQDRVPSKWPAHFGKFAIFAGLCYSLYEFGGMRLFTQWLEVGAAITFLWGSYRLAAKHTDGYLWYIPMHVLTIVLAHVQGMPWFVFQQLASLGFVIDAYIVNKRKKGRGRM